MAARFTPAQQTRGKISWYPGASKGRGVLPSCSVSSSEEPGRRHELFLSNQTSKVLRSSSHAALPTGSFDAPKPRPAIASRPILAASHIFASPPSLPSPAPVPFIERTSSAGDLRASSSLPPSHLPPKPSLHTTRSSPTLRPRPIEPSALPRPGANRPVNVPTKSEMDSKVPDLRRHRRARSKSRTRTHCHGSKGLVRLTASKFWQLLCAKSPPRATTWGGSMLHLPDFVLLTAIACFLFAGRSPLRGGTIPSRPPLRYNPALQS